jgi:hypothetical protein
MMQLHIGMQTAHRDIGSKLEPLIKDAISAQQHCQSIVIDAGKGPSVSDERHIMMSRYVFTRRGMRLFAFLFALRERERECNASAGLENVWARDLSTFLGRSLRRVLLFDRLHRFEEGALGGTIPFGGNCDKSAQRQQARNERRGCPRRQGKLV